MVTSLVLFIRVTQLVFSLHFLRTNKHCMLCCFLVFIQNHCHMSLRRKKSGGFLEISIRNDKLI